MPLTMEHLWDEVLSEITQYLSVDDIFACRLVCKRLEGLARHPNVWRHRRIRIGWACACAVLRLAPCLREIVWLAVPPPQGSKCSYQALGATKCAVESLVLEMWTDPDPRSEFAQVEVVRRQMALGRLKHVTMKPDPRFTAQDGMVCDSLWDVLLQSSCLQSLRFLDCVPWPTSSMKRGPSKSSLVLFKCFLTKRSESFVKSVLAGHAESLEEVDLNEFPIPFTKYDSTVVSLEILELLAGMARLRRLKYVRLSSVEPLAACQTLRDVTFTTMWPGTVPRDGLLKFLREANQLRALTIYPAREDNWKEIIDAVLVSSGLSLERLSFKVLKDLPLEPEPLVEALPQFRALRQLALEPELLEECNELLLAITPALAPALRRLELVLVRPDPSTSYEQPMSDDCGHRWVHGDAVKATLTTNPMLHIHLRRPWACFDLGKDCEPCASVCHLQAGWNFRGRLVLFAHGPDNCPVPEEHTADSKWRCVHLPYISA